MRSGSGNPGNGEGSLKAGGTAASFARRCRACLALLALGCVAAVLAPGSSAGTDRPELRLGDGGSDDFLWVAHASDGLRRGRHPCITVEFVEPDGHGGRYYNLAGGCGPMRIPAQPVMFRHPTCCAHAPRTLFGLGFAREVARVHLKIRPVHGSTRDSYSRAVRLHLLTQAQAERAGIRRRFRWAVFIVRGKRCIAAVTTYGADGRRLSSGPGRCP